MDIGKRTNQKGEKYNDYNYLGRGLAIRPKTKKEQIEISSVVLHEKRLRLFIAPFIF